MTSATYEETFGSSFQPAAIRRPVTVSGSSKEILSTTLIATDTATVTATAAATARTSSRHLSIRPNAHRQGLLLSGPDLLFFFLLFDTHDCPRGAIFDHCASFVTTRLPFSRGCERLSCAAHPHQLDEASSIYDPSSSIRRPNVHLLDVDHPVLDFLCDEARLLGQP